MGAHRAHAGDSPRRHNRQWLVTASVVLLLGVLGLLLVIGLIVL